MKKFLYPTVCSFGILAAFIIVSCTKSKNTPDSIQGTNKEQSTGTGANPNIGVVTVTGMNPVTNPATRNSSLQVSGPGWSYDACTNSTATNGSSSLTGHNGSTSVNLVFGSTVGLGVTAWTLVDTNPGVGQARLVISNAPGQPDGITWYSKSGTVTVNTTASQTSATFSNVQCLQTKFLFPVVTVSGALICQ